MSQRPDKRAPDQMRPVKMTRQYNKYAEGSCLIEVGDTRVICTASVEDRVPPFLRGTGQGWVSAEYGMIPRSTSQRMQRETGKPSGRTLEIQRLIGRSLRSITDLKGFGDRTVWIDCDVIQADGGTRTAAITGAFVALVDAFDSLKKRQVINRIPIFDQVAATSVGVVGTEERLDLMYEEDSIAEVDMNVIMTDKKKLVEIQGTAEGAPFSRDTMNRLVNLAEKGITELLQMQRDVLKGTFQ
ncbi:MAG: ribonuclease PH [Armatimonadetes bacterium]|nr:ribonuclease PH [Armatimonadota bacterium]